MALNYAYTTLITRSSYLAGVIVLAHTLKKHGTKYPLVVLYTHDLPRSSIRALEAEAPCSNLILKKTAALLPRANVHVNLIAERFADTWTKLRVFEVFEDVQGKAYDAVCYLDADMMILNKNMDSIFEHIRLPSHDWIAANHACVCNKDRDPWAPEEWKEENCAYTPMKHPDALTHPTPVTPDARPTYHLLNSGMFVYKPSPKLWERMLNFFNTTPSLGEFKFPDQDFLAEFFRNRWVSVGWQYNALKTMRYWHPAMWCDDEVICLHYIVDKPWAKRVGEDGLAGYLGRDGETHRWWWNAYEKWVKEREASGQEVVLSVVKNHVAKPIGEEGEESEEMRAIGSQVQAFAKKKSNREGDQENGAMKGQEPNGDASDKQLHEQGPHGPVLRKKMLGEQGRGPVVHNNKPHINGHS